MPIPGLIHTFEFEQLDATVVYSLDTIIVLIMSFRIYHIFRLFAEFSKWTDVKPQKYCNYNNVEANTIFALKASNIEHPYVIISSMLVIWIVLFGFYVRLFERVLADSAFEHIWNGGWLTILNMTTIGYGEIYPVTHLGRLTVIVSCILGVFLLSL